MPKFFCDLTGRILLGMMQLQCLPEYAGQELNRISKQFFTFPQGPRLLCKTMSAELIVIRVSQDVKFDLRLKSFI